MHAQKVKYLEHLLLQSLEKLELTGRAGVRPRLQEYREWLQKCRAAYDPNISRIISLVDPEVRDAETKENILDFLRIELAEYIEEDRIMAANLSGGAFDHTGQPVERLMTNLLKRAIVDGAAKAAQAFDQCIISSSVSYCQLFLILGIRVREEMELLDGIRLIPLPETRDEFPFYLPIHIDRTGITFELKTLVRVEYESSPVFHRPSEPFGLDGPFRSAIKSNDVEAIDMPVLCQALSLAYDCSVGVQASWTSTTDYEIADIGSMVGIGADTPSVVIRQPYHADPRDAPFVDNMDVANGATKDLYNAIITLREETKKSIKIPVERWMKSKDQIEPVDKMIELGIAFESLYLSGNEGQIASTIAIRVALHLGNSGPERKLLLKRVKEIYDARSKAVHEGRLDPQKYKTQLEILELVSGTQDLCRQAILKTIIQRAIPDREGWEDLILGVDSR